MRNRYYTKYIETITPRLPANEHGSRDVYSLWTMWGGLYSVPASAFLIMASLA